MLAFTTGLFAIAFCAGVVNVLSFIIILLLFISFVTGQLLATQRPRVEDGLRWPFTLHGLISNKVTTFGHFALSYSYLRAATSALQRVNINSAIIMM